jgi:hypothetical protein
MILPLVYYAVIVSDAIMTDMLKYYVVYRNIRVRLMVVPGTLEGTADLTEAYRQRMIYRTIRGCERWLKEKLPYCEVTGTIDQEADGWTLQLIVKPKAIESNG